MEIARWDELQLVQRCKEGSESAYAELVHRHRPRLFTLAYRLTANREAAEDVVQETFVSAFRALDRFEPRPSLAAWLNTIVIRNAGRAAAKATAMPRASLDTLIADQETAHGFPDLTATDANDPHRAAEAAELRRDLEVAIQALPFKYRAAVVTRFVLGLDGVEAAGAHEMGLNTYKSHLLRGTRMLREALTSAGRGPGTPQPTAIAPVIATAAPLGSAVHTPRATTARGFAESRRTRFGERLPRKKAVRG